MIMRALTNTGDWTFGRGKNDYLSGRKALAQSIQTRISSFLNDCFFDLSAGIDWFNLLGSKNTKALDLAIRSVILNTENVTGLLEFSLEVNDNRRISITYSVTTVFSGVTNTNGSLAVKAGFLLTEDGNILVTEDGEPLEV